MLYIDVGNTLRGGLRTGIQRVVRSLSYELATASPADTRLIAFDVDADRYFALATPALIRSADSPSDIGSEGRLYLELDDLTPGDIFFEPDSSWTEPLNKSGLYVIRFYTVLDSGIRLEARGLLTVVAGEGADDQD
jgi:hypothetical protein